MAWPQSTDFLEAVQNLVDSTTDEELRDGQVACTPLGLPMLWAGNFADVFKVHCSTTNNTWALKCFTRPVSGLHERYHAIASHLKKAKLPFTVDFQFLDRGIRINKDWFPALKMRWVEGLTLSQFIEEHLDRPNSLKKLLGLWLKLATRLRKAEITHADLQHGNILLVPQNESSFALRLVDYDGMFVPALANARSGELGHPAYQHPQRLTQGTYNAEVDRFPHLAIYTAIHCLAFGRDSLWRQFNNGDNLLFREEDFRDPGHSRLFQQLWRTPPDADARTLVGRLILACKLPLEKTPLLDDILLDGKPLPLNGKQEAVVNAILTPTAVRPIQSPPMTVASLNASVGSRPAVGMEQPLPPPPPPPPFPGPQKSHAARGSIFYRAILAPFRVVDRVLQAMAGADNTLLHNFFRIVIVLLVFGLPIGLSMFHSHLQSVHMREAALLQQQQEAERKEALAQAAQEEALRKQMEESRRKKAENDAAANRLAHKERALPLPIKLKPIGPQTVKIGEPLTIPVLVENADHWKGKLQYRLASGSLSGASVNLQTGVFTWTPRKEQECGKHHVEVLIEGPESQKTQVSFTITVTQPTPSMQEHTIESITGNVVDMERKPVAGATVWLLFLGNNPRTPSPSPPVIAQAESNEKGQFHVKSVKWTPPPGFARRYPALFERSHGFPSFLIAVARDSLGRIGGQVYKPNDPGSRDQIQLQNSKDYHGRLVDTSGQPIAGARIIPEGFRHEYASFRHSTNPFPFMMSFPFPPALQVERTVKTNARGAFTIRNLPVRGEISLSILAEGFGKQSGVFNLEKQAMIKIGRAGTVQGSLTCEKDPKAAAGVRLGLFLRSRPLLFSSSVLYCDVGVTQGDGTFRLENVPPGPCQVCPQLPDASPYYAEDSDLVEVKSDETTTVSLTLQPEMDQTLPTVRKVRVFSSHTAVLAIAFSHDGRSVLGWMPQKQSSTTATVLLWDAATGKEIRTFTMPEKTIHVSYLALSPDGQKVLTVLRGINSSIICFWDVSTGQKLYDLAAGPEKGSSSGGMMFQNGRKILPFKNSLGEINACALSPDGRLVVGVGSTIRIWDATTGHRLRTISMNKPKGETWSTLSSVAFSPDGERLLTGDNRGEVTLWDVKDGKALRKFGTRTTDMGNMHVAFSEDGRQILTCMHHYGVPAAQGLQKMKRGCAVAAWDVDSGEKLYNYPLNEERPFMFSPNGQWILGATKRHKALTIGNATTGKPFYNILVKNVTAAAFSPDGRRLLTGAVDGAALWDLDSLERGPSASGHGETYKPTVSEITNNIQW